MDASKRGLGRGLEALLPDAEPKQEVALADITLPADQPREHFAEQGIIKLSTSIKQHGILQPLVVVAADGGYRLIAGERRLRAAKLAGLSHVPVFIRTDTSQRHFELALIENLQRSNLTPVEEAKAFSRLLDESDLTQDALAKQLGVGRSKIALTLRLLQLPASAQRALNEERITAGHAQAILSAPAERQEQLLEAILQGKLSVRAAERLAKGTKPRQAPSAQPAWAADLSQKLGSQVSVRGTVQKGTLRIAYHSADELERITKRLNGG